MKWRRHARLALAVFAAAFAVWVAFAFKTREPPAAPPQPPRQTDPQAVVESTGGRLVRYKGTHEDVTVDFRRQLTYANGATKLTGITVRTQPKNGGRSFVITGNEGDVGENQSTIRLDGDVRLATNDGLSAATEHASYVDAQAIIRAPGPATFTQGRLSGSGVGVTYDKNRDVLTVADQAVVHQAAEGKGGDALSIAAGSATIARQDGYIQFERGMHLARGEQTIQADNGVASLAADRKHIQSIDLHGGAHIGSAHPARGALESLVSRDMTLHYASGGDVLQQVTALGDAVIQLAGDPGRPGERISAATLDIALAPDGSTPTSVTAQNGVEFVLPSSDGTASRTIGADSFVGAGEGGYGLTHGRFTGRVKYRDREPNSFRGVNAGLADVSFTPGSDDIDRVEFSQAVQVETERISASAPLVRYAPRQDALELTGAGAASPMPHVVTAQVIIDAQKIDLTPAGPKVKATGGVKSVLQPAKPGGDPKTATKLPSMLKQDQPVNVTADALAYDGAASRAVYTGKAQLWQGETTVKGATITIDDRTGDLAATGPVATTTVFDQESKEKKTKERVRSLGTSKDFQYNDAAHRATYTGDVHMSGPQGDVTTDRMEMFLKPSGDELERAEAYGHVTLREPNRTTTGERMTYFADEERYLVTGAPVKVVDACGRETIGRTLTFLKAADTIVVDGNTRNRTQTKGGSGCK